MAYDPNDPTSTLPQEEEFGANFTGQRAGPGPMQSIMAPAAQPPGGGGFLDNPADRAALLQIGLGLMQPVAMGQTVGGHIGQAIGGGGEAAGRGEALDIKEQLAESKLRTADERLRIAQQNADTRERRATGGAIRGISKNLEYRMQRDQMRDEAEKAKETNKYLDTDVNDIFKRTSDPYAVIDPKDPDFKYKGKTRSQIRNMLQSEQSSGGAAATAAPAAGARQAADGNWYVPDPARPGKYLKVNP